MQRSKKRPSFLPLNVLLLLDYPPQDHHRV